MTTIVCIIPTTATDAIYPSLHRCVTSVLESCIPDISVIIILTTTNKKPQLKQLLKHVDHIIHVDNNPGFSDLNNEALKFSLKIFHPHIICS